MLMDNYIKQLRQYVANNPILFDMDCDHPALDSLCWHFDESHYMGNEATKAVSSKLNDEFAHLSYEENNKVFSLVGALCAEHERIAFLAGLHLGAQLILELQADNDSTAESKI